MTVSSVLIPNTTTTLISGTPSGVVIQNLGPDDIYLAIDESAIVKKGIMLPGNSTLSLARFVITRDMKMAGTINAVCGNSTSTVLTYTRP